MYLTGLCLKSAGAQRIKKTCKNTPDLLGMPTISEAESPPLRPRARTSQSRCQHHPKRESQHHVSGCDALRIDSIANHTRPPYHSRPNGAHRRSGRSRVIFARADRVNVRATHLPLRHGGQTITNEKCFSLAQDGTSKLVSMRGNSFHAFEGALLLHFPRWRATRPISKILMASALAQPFTIYTRLRTVF